MNISLQEVVATDLSETEIATIMKLANTGFGIEMSEQDVRNHLFKSDKIFLLQDQGQIVGFSSIKFLGPLTYRFGSVIDNKYQKKGIYTHLSNYVSGNTGFLRTQNYNIIKALEKAGYQIHVGELAYDFMTTRVSKEEIDLFFAGLDDGVNKFDKGIFKKVYGGPMGTKETVNFLSKLWLSNFDYKQGDALLVAYER